MSATDPEATAGDGPVLDPTRAGRQFSATEFGRSWGSLVGIGLFAVVLLVLAPALLSDFRLNNLGKYCCWAIVAVGIGLAWGRGGMLVMGQGVFFALGAYAMAMHLTPVNKIKGISF